MEELKLLIDMVAQLPETAMWLLAAYFFYKITIVGSVYGIIRLGIMKLHDVLVARKVEYKEIRAMLDGMCIRDESSRLIGQLHRLKGKGTGIHTSYIHSQSIDWLREAIDAKEKLDAERKVQS